MTSSLSFPGCSHPGLVVAPSPGFDFTGLVVGSLLAPRSWVPPSQSSPFSHSVTFWRLCGASWSPPLFPRLLRRALAYGLKAWPLPLVSRPWTGFCWSHLLSLSSGVYSPASPICPTSSVLRLSSFGISASVFVSSLHDGVTLPGRDCLSPRSERRLFLHLPGVWLESSRWDHPVGSSFSDLDRNEDSLRTFPSGWRQAFAMGSPVSGRVALFCALDRNEGFFRSFILRCFAMGSSCGSRVFFSHSIVTKFTLDS